MLAVYVHEHPPQLAQGGEGHGTVVDEGAAFSGGGDLATEDAVAVVVVEVLFLEEWPHVIFAEVEVCLHDAPVAPRLDGLGVGSLAQEEPQGAEDDALAGSRFTGDDGETSLEGDVELVDEGEVLDV